jgi:hypothetical protein
MPIFGRLLSYVLECPGNLPPVIKGVDEWTFLGILLEEILMKQSRYIETQILAILRQAGSRMPIAALCREDGMSDASFYKWQAKYG